jgi:hypothetical protein
MINILYIYINFNIFINNKLNIKLIFFLNKLNLYIIIYI